MRKFFFAAAIGLITLLASTPASLAQATDPDIAAKHAIGEIKSVDAAAKQLTIKTDAGSILTVSLSDKTTYKKLAPGEQTLTNATDVTFADLAEGDRIMARGAVSEDRKSVPASQIIVMTKGDLAKKQDAERAEWRRRGILGVITALKPDNKRDHHLESHDGGHAKSSLFQSPKRPKCAVTLLTRSDLATPSRVSLAS